MTSNPSQTPLPFLAFANDSKDLEVLKAFAAAQRWSDGCIFQGDIATATDFLKNHPAPPLLLVEIATAAGASAQLDALAEVCDADTKVIIIGDINEYSFYCWLTDIGIFSYLLRPLTGQMLEGALEKSVAKPQGGGKQERQPGKVIAVLGTRGGVGSTTLAINLAGIIADLSKKNVALIDADPQEGSISLMLDLEPSRGFREALEKPDRIDSLFIERVMAKPMKHLSVLSSEESLQERFNIHDQAVELLLKELRDKFEVIILDIPRFLTPFTQKCLSLADHVVLVTELSLLNLRDTLRHNDMMRELFKIKPPVIVANRVGAAAKFEMSPADFEKGIGAKIDFSVPYLPEMYMQIGTDITALKSKDHAAVKPLLKLAETLVPEAKIPTAAVKKGKSAFHFLSTRKKVVKAPEEPKKEA
jgi:pilus assembly protein CpaE